MTILVIVLSLATALCFAAGYVLQYHEAHEAPQRLFLSPKMLLELLHHRLWVAGLLVMFVGDGLQAAALAVGSLAVVEPFLTTALLFALPISAAWRRERLRRREWTAALLICVGLAALLGIGSPTIGRSDMSGLEWMQVVVAACGAAAIMVIYGKRASSEATRAALIGGGAGVLFGLQDVLTRFCLNQMHHGILSLGLAWQPYLSVVIGVYAIALMQSAYKAGPLTNALPPIAVGEPVVGMLIGVFALNEHLRQSAPALTAEAAGALLMVIGTWLLGRSPLVCGKHHPTKRLKTATAELKGASTEVAKHFEDLLPERVRQRRRTVSLRYATLNLLTLWSIFRSTR